MVRAFTYLGYEAVNLETYINALRNDEFANMTVEDFQKAIRNGARGVYGRTYKMCVQEVLIWAREYYKSLPLTQRTGVVEHWNKDLPTGL